MKIYSVAINRIVYLFIYLYFWNFYSLYGQNNFSVRIYDSEDGLPSYAVLSHIIQSKEGYIYTVSNDGIIRFDGLRFELLNSDNSSPEKQTFNTLYQDSQNRIWYGSQGNGIGLFSKPDTLDFMHPGYVKTILEFPDNILWIGADGNGLWRLDLKADSLKPKTVLPDTIGPTINDLASDGKDHLFIATNEGLYIINTRKMSVSKVTGGNVLAVNADPFLPENMVLYSTSEGLFVRNLTGKNATKIQHPNLSWPPVDIITHPDGGYLIVTLHALYLLKNNKLKQIYNRDDAVFFSAAIDHEKNIWIGTETSGLIQLIPTKIGQYSAEEGLPSDVVTVVLQSKKGKMYTGTTSGLVITNSNFEHTDVIYKNNFISTLFEDQYGDIWVGLRNKGLRRIGKKYDYLYTPSDGLPSPYIWTMAQNKGGRLLAGTLKGVAVFDPEANRWYPLFTAENGMLQHNDVRAILAGSDGSFWVGTSFGLHHIKGDSVAIYDTAGELQNAVILDLYKQSGNLWIATSGGGLYRFTGGTFRQIPVSKTGAKIWRLIQSGRRLWFSSETGIHTVNIDSLNNWLDGNTSEPEILRFDQRDGLPGELVGALQPSGWKLDNGRFWFPTFNGIAVFSDSIRKKKDIPPPIIINHLIAGSDTLLPHQSISFSRFKGHINIEYTAFSFKNPDLISYSYKLEGFDEQWNQVGSRRTAVYTNLPAGKYQFKVKARIGSEGMYSKSAGLPLTIRPLFYETWWFVGLIILIIGLAVFGIMQYRKLQRTKLQQLRMQIARDLHDEIGSNLGSISLRSRMLTKNKRLEENQRSALQEINRISRETAVAMRDIIWLVHSDKDKIDDLNIKLRHIASQLLGDIRFDYTYRSGNDNQSITLEKRRNIVFIYKEMLHNVVKHAQADNVKIAIAAEHKQLCVEVEDDGRGFNPDQTESSGMGLKNMQNRAGDINGILKIRSKPGEGTRLSLKVPIP